MINDKIKEKMEEYEIESIDEFVPEFYTMNLKNGYAVESKAIKNLFDRYTKEELILIENYDEIGIVEFVADDQFYIENNQIIPYRDL